MDVRRKDTLSAVLEAATAAARVERGSLTFLASDSRELLPQLPDESIDCTITSPPYAELKDYGADGQLGFGQRSTDAYLRDLGKVLAELLRVSKKGAALWVVLDTVKTSGKALVLPWEVISRAQQAGWNFEDLVIWDKGRSLPWSHVGHFRGVFEYVLLFSKEGLKNFSLDRIREIDDLSPYWVKYPERYNPSGKAPSDLWHFPIPIQGSWSKNEIRHHCPFPVGMVARMVALTSRPNDVVLDPFAGTGTVLVVANYLGRRAIGIDLNTKFVRNFESKGFEALVQVVRGELRRKNKKRNGFNLSALIVKLRMLKLPRTLFTEFARPDRLGNDARKSVAAFLLTSRETRQKAKSGFPYLGSVSVRVLARRGSDLTSMRQHTASALTVPPLSKFGLKVNVDIVSERQWRDARYFSRMSGTRWFSYGGGKFYEFGRMVPRTKLGELIQTLTKDEKSRIPPIVSTLRARVTSPVADYK